jgi:hypothetical protein
VNIRVRGEFRRGQPKHLGVVDSKRIDPAARVEALRAEAQELRVLANAARSQGVRTLLNIEAADREEQAEALENWLKTGGQDAG